MNASRALATASLLVLLAPAASHAGTAPTWMPDVPGWRWGYLGPLGARDSVVGRGVESFDGVQAIRLDHVLGADAGLQQFWINTGRADVGSLLFAGFFRPSENFGIRYEPPLRFMRGPALVGDNWVVSATPVMLPGGIPGETFALEFRVMDVIEPGLVGEAYGVTYALLPPSLAPRGAAAYSLTGRARAGDASARGVPPDEPLDWFAAGFGQVRFRRGGDLYVLTSVDAPVPVAHSTWGRIKRLYR